MLQSAASANDPARAAEMRAAAIDALRTGLGEMVDTQVAEARRMETELTDLARRVWPAPTTETTEAYRRRWTVKE